MTNRDEFLATRRHGIGGSDVAPILGLSKFRTALDVFNDKTEQAAPQEETEAMHWGTVLEDAIAKEFQHRTGMKVQRVTKTLRKGVDGWMIANIDRAVVNPKISSRVTYTNMSDGNLITTDTILECKTANAFAAREWGPSQEDDIVAGREPTTEHKIPVYYETQVQWYLGVTGASICYVAVLIGGSDYRMYRVDRDDDVIQALVNACSKFWFENVKKGTPPAPQTADETVALFPKDNGEMVEATNEVAAKVGDLINLEARIKALSEEKDAIKNFLCATIGEKTGITIGGNVACTYKASTRNTVNTAALKKAEPAIYQQYLRATTCRTFRLA